MLGKEKKMKRHALAFTLISLVSALLVGCGKKKTQVENYLRLNYDEYTLFEDESFVLDGSTNLATPISYSSENNRIASVSTSGRVIAKKQGQTRIVASVETLKVYCKLTIKPLSEKTTDYITFTENEFVIGLNENQTYQINPSYHSGESVLEKTFTYRCDDPTIATVNENGVVSALKQGTTSILVSSGNVSASVFIDIYNFKMNTPEDWMTMLATTKNKYARFYLNQDIDMAGVAYAPSSSYVSELIALMGELNGGYHSVRNITMSTSLVKQSIFGFATAFSLYNIAFENIVFTSTIIGNNCGLFVSYMHHITEQDSNGNDKNNIYPAVINNVICDFKYTNSSGNLISENFYGGSVQNVFGIMRDVNGNPLDKSNSYAIGKEFLLWWDPNSVSNIICYVPTGDISIEPAHESEGSLQISLASTFKTNSLIEADYLASSYFDKNIWNINLNEIPSFK